MADITTLREILFDNINKFIHVNSFWKNQIDTDPFLKDSFITVDLVFGNGKKFSYSTDMIQVYGENNELITYEPLLQEDIEISSSYTIGEGRASQRTFTITLDGRKIDPLDIILNNNFLAGIAEVCLQVNGASIKNRLVLLRGEMSGGLNFGVANELIELQVSDLSLSTDRIVPEFLITEEDFPELPDDQKGMRFAVVKDNCTCGIPCVRTSSYEFGTNFIVGLGHNIKVDEVLLNGIPVPSNDLQRGWSVETAYTSSGIAYTYLDFVFPLETAEGTLGVPTTTAGQPWNDNDSVYVKVSSIDGSNRSIIEISREILIEGNSFGSSVIDEEMFSRSQAKLPFLLGEVLLNASSSESSTKAVQYIESTVCDSFPMISLMYSSRGIGIVATDRRSQLFTGSFIVGQDLIFDRSTGITETAREDIFNSFTLRYGYDAVNNNFTKTITRNKDSSVICEISENRLGKRDKEPIDSILIQSDSTAEYVIEWMVHHYAFPSYYLEYECSPAMFFKIKLGDNIRITDEELGFVDELATIEKINFTKGVVTIGLRFWLLYDRLSKSA